MILVHPHAPTPTRQQRTTEGVTICPFTILVDTREQSPWTFQGTTIANREIIVKRQVVTIATGDYTVQGCESWFTIERKSGDDFIGSLGAGHQRFRREHERMGEIVQHGGYAAVMIEDSLDRLINELEEGTNGRKMAPESVIGAVASWPQRYGVHYLFAGSRRMAEVLALRTMWKFWERQQKLIEELF